MRPDLGDSHDALEMSEAALQSLQSFAVVWAMGIDFRHCFRARLKVCAFAACRALRPVFHNRLCTRSLVPGAFESRARPSEACFLTPWDSINDTASQHFHSFNKRTRECSEQEERKDEGSEKWKASSRWCGQDSSRIKMSTSSNVSVSSTFLGMLYLGESLCLSNRHLLHIMVGFELGKRKWIRKSLPQRNLQSRKRKQI